MFSLIFPLVSCIKVLTSLFYVILVKNATMKKTYFRLETQLYYIFQFPEK